MKEYDEFSETTDLDDRFQVIMDILTAIIFIGCLIIAFIIVKNNISTQQVSHVVIKTVEIEDIYKDNDNYYTKVIDDETSNEYIVCINEDDFINYTIGEKVKMSHNGNHLYIYKN